MESRIQRADANGQILKAGGRGRGFRLVPAVPLPSENSDRKARPGCFPVELRFRGGRNAGGGFAVINSDAIYFADEFEDFDVRQLAENDCFQVQVFEAEPEGVIPAGAKSRVGVHISDAVAIANGGTPSGTDGFPLTPNTTKVTSYFGGTARVLTLWVRTLAGTWHNTRDTVDLTDTSVPLFDTRLAVAGADRWVWIAAGASCTVAVDAEVEVG